MPVPTGTHIKQSIRQTTLDRWAFEHKMLDKLYEKYEQGVEQRNMAVSRFADEIGESRAPVDLALRTFDRIGILGRRLEYGHDTAADREKGLVRGRNYHWTLLVSKNEATARLSSQQAQEKENMESGRPLYASVPWRGNAPTRKSASNGHVDSERVVTTTATEDEETKAISGPERPSPFASLAPLRKLDDAQALLAAARQYRDRRTTVESKVDEVERTMASVGVKFDRAAFLASLEFEQDEVLDTVAKLLPHIDSLERKIKTQSDQMDALKAKAASVGKLEAENATLRAQNQRLIGTRVGTEQRDLASA